MFGAGAKEAELGEVVLGAVAFVLGKAIAGVEGFEFGHHLVAGHFSEEGGGDAEEG